MTLFLCVEVNELDDDPSGVRGGETALRANPIVARAAVLEVGDPGVEEGEGATVQDFNLWRELSKLLRGRNRRGFSVSNERR